jgi:succinate dehydrogenase (ubiquinone) membrane anchor subunit
VPVRGVVALMTGVTYLGIMKVNLAGPGLTQTIKSLWS